jgi:hypothetical protein
VAVQRIADVSVEEEHAPQSVVSLGRRLQILRLEGEDEAQLGVDGELRAHRTPADNHEEPARTPSRLLVELGKPLYHERA